MTVKDMDELKRCYQVVMQQLFAEMPPAERFQSATPEQIAAAINALPPEVREEIKQRLH